MLRPGDWAEQHLDGKCHISTPLLHSGCLLLGPRHGEDRTRPSAPKRGQIETASEQSLWAPQPSSQCRWEAIHLGGQICSSGTLSSRHQRVGGRGGTLLAHRCIRSSLVPCPHLENQDGRESCNCQWTIDFPLHVPSPQLTQLGWTSGTILTHSQKVNWCKVFQDFEC